jgi:hypothetical protein
MIFDAVDYLRLAPLFRLIGYKGYKPAEREAPNSDGRVDEGKRYLHVALKYDPPAWAVEYLARAHFEACRVAEALRVPDAFYPRVENGTLRVLEYPAGAGSAEHTDFDLFTILCWRSTPEDLELTHAGRGDYAPTAGPDTIDAARAIDPHLHIGRIGELVGLGPATPHRVPARPYAQKALVYFAMPAMAARLPGTNVFQPPGFSRFDYVKPGPTVREWLDDVYAKSRVYTCSPSGHSPWAW